jgi:NAD(P)-dependent dehydrogenase (short-subunit alcohol dehydrogenase family)
MTALDGRVAIVTGAAQGIGRAIADGLAAEGARIVVADLKGAEEAAGRYPDGVGLTVDVAKEDDVERMAAETVQRAGGIDILVNNAGLYASLAMRPFDQIPLDEWRQVMDVNVASMFLTCRAVVPRMRERAGGRIVNISSGTPFSCTTSRARARSSRSRARWPRSSAATRSSSTASRRASR